jgi:predicted ABC-type ATPase
LISLNPKLYIIAGPNGAGKTTFARRFLPGYTKSREFVNADEIALRISPANPEGAALKAGREMLERINSLGEQRVDFCIETTLSGRSYVPILKNFKAVGYEIHLFFLWLPDVQMAINRVADRVRKGGHNIPEHIIRRRYASGVKNLFADYRHLLDSWTLFDNSRLRPYRIASESGRILTVWDETLLAQFMKTPEESGDQKLQETPQIPEWMQAMSAMREAVGDVIEEHLKTGHPLIIWRNGKVYRQPPEEARREMEQALKNEPLCVSPTSGGFKKSTYNISR